MLETTYSAIGLKYQSLVALMHREQLPVVNKKPRIWIRGLLLNYVKLVHIITDAGLVFSYQRVQILSFGCIECDNMC